MDRFRCDQYGVSYCIQAVAPMNLPGSQSNIIPDLLRSHVTAKCARSSSATRFLIVFKFNKSTSMYSICNTADVQGYIITNEAPQHFARQHLEVLASRTAIGYTY